ncbi:MAG: hypothetical protein IRY94_06655, partial [Rhodospirillaceae bacterium]|nr:hypothetical protein [Rhodospirillaceae bacterium]
RRVDTARRSRVFIASFKARLNWSRSMTRFVRLEEDRLADPSFWRNFHECKPKYLKGNVAIFATRP